ncbi:putative endonuclease lcl3 [Saitozyma podzolica]|uniref:Probable endonuclease LCL3 n=1 Tax=Saitozyma podzolica TaxID=1890683 RepID=A0A427YE74_9TREE|nr:putative endonuclease lcl3 [Saitozyma podzolica]
MVERPSGGARSRDRASAPPSEDLPFVLPSPLESITSWFPSSSSSSPSPKSPSSYLPQDPVVAAAVSGFAAAGITLLSVCAYRRYAKRIRNSDYVTSGMLDRKRWIRGVVTSVGDGDNFRLFHTPLFYRFPLKLRSIPSTPKELKDETIHIRIAGVDAPEAAHFGNPAQPHSQESLAWLRGTIMGKSMSCQLLRKDQYNRIVAVPYIKRWWWTDRPLPLMMLKDGMAVVYTSGGGEYGPWGLTKMQAIEADAKRQNKGLWAIKKFEHPADYKKRVKAAEEGMVGAGDTAKRQSRGWWASLKSIFGARR